jgi:hypothetical protein
MALHDFVNDVIKTGFYWWPPFYLGRTLCKTSTDLRRLLVVLVVAGLIYIPLLLIEFRFSPQLNRWLYGYHQHEFQQTVRGDHYRPMVFMNHGLNVALFMVVAVFAAAGLGRVRQRVLGFPAVVAGLLLLAVLLLFRSAGATLFAVVGLVAILALSPRMQLRVAGVIALLVLSYPLVRALNLLPVEGTLRFFESLFGADRAGSLGIRLRNEGILLQHAAGKPWFGWGGYARNFVYDPVSGSRISIVDGYWILSIGARGLVGFLAIFLLLLLPIWRSQRALAHLPDPRDRKLVGCLALIVAFCVADQIPNATVDPYIVFLAGVLSRMPRGLKVDEAISRRQPDLQRPVL